MSPWTVVPRRQSLLDDVRDRAVVSIEDVDDACTAQPSGVERLPARRRIERRLIEDDDSTAVNDFARNDGGVKSGEKRIGVIQPFGHG